MIYSPLRKRLATLLSKLSDSHLNLALPAAIEVPLAVGALAYNTVALLDIGAKPYPYLVLPKKIYA